MERVKIVNVLRYRHATRRCVDRRSDEASPGASLGPNDPGVDFLTPLLTWLQVVTSSACLSWTTSTLYKLNWARVSLLVHLRPLNGFRTPSGPIRVLRTDWRILRDMFDAKPGPAHRRNHSEQRVTQTSESYCIPCVIALHRCYTSLSRYICMHILYVMCVFSELIGCGLTWKLRSRSVDLWSRVQSKIW